MTGNLFSCKDKLVSADLIHGYVLGFIRDDETYQLPI